jgi:hypothetical protein
VNRRVAAWARWLRHWATDHWISLTLVALCAAVVDPIALRPGWPYNHDVTALFELVETFRREFTAGNFYPLWSPFSFNGHGTPMPFFYHRLFNSGAGLLALLFGTVAAVKIGFVLSLIIGALGMSAAARELGLPPWMRVWCGALLPISHYTFTDWLVRGSAAELTAAMLVAWLIAACLRMLAGRSFGVRMGAVLVLLFYAHIVVFLYSIVLLAVALLCCALGRRGTFGAEARRLGGGIGVAAAMVVAGTAVHAIAIPLVGREFNLARLGQYRPQREFRPPWTYFVDNFPWGHTWRGLSVEVGRFLVVALAAMGGVALVKRARVPAQSFVFLAAGALAYFWFQLPMASTFFDAVPLAQIIQFPWRLLVFITPLAILALGLLVRAVYELGGRWPHVAVAVLAGTWTAQASFAMTAYRADYEWITPDAMKAHLAHLDGPYAGGEHKPKAFASRGLPPRAPLFRFEGCRLLSSNVDLAALEQRPFETVELRVASAAPAGCRIHFSQFWTSLIEVQPSAGGRAVRAADETTDVILPAGEGGVRIARRGLWRTLAHVIRNPPAP